MSTRRRVSAAGDLRRLRFIKGVNTSGIEDSLRVERPFEGLVHANHGAARRCKRLFVASSALVRETPGDGLVSNSGAVNHSYFSFRGKEAPQQTARPVESIRL